MNTLLFSDLLVPGSIISWAVFIVVLGGVVALVALGLRQLGWNPPQFVVQAFWIVIVVFVIVIAIVLMARLTGVG